MLKYLGVVGWCEGVVYLTSPGRPTVIGLQLPRLAILVAGKGRVGNVFISSVSSLSFLFLFLPCPAHSFISSTMSSISFLPFSGRRHKMTHKG